MKIQLQKLENRIRELMEIRILQIFPGAKLEKLAIHKLASALHTNISEQSGAYFAPHIYTLITHPDSLARWQDPRVLGALKDSILAVGHEANLKFKAPPTLAATADETLPRGELKVLASFNTEKLEPTDSISRESPGELEDLSKPDNAFLIIDGRKIFPLTSEVVNIGRRLENNLTIDDPRVSRTHAQLRSIKGRYVIFDLNSTGGTFINGKRISQTILYPGDVISLAGVNLVYGQDNPLPRPDLKDTGPLNPDPMDRKTAIFKSPSDFLKPKK